MGLDIFVAEEEPLSGKTDDRNFHTNQRIWYDEWDDLLQNVLQSPIETERLEGEDRAAFDDRRERMIQEDLASKGYPMLGRIWYYFSDAFYARSEIEQLLKECLELQQKTESKNASSALEKLVFACRQALEVKSGMFLACD